METSPMSRFFSDLRIKIKLMLGFAAVLLLLLISSASSYYGLAVIGEDAELLKQRTEVIEIARDIDYEFLNLRRYAREYALTGDDEDIKLANEWGKKVDERLKDALKTVKNPERLAKLRAAEDGIKTYLKHFEQAAKFKHEEDKLLAETMDPTGLKMRTTLDDYIAAAATAGNSTAAM
jgi:CHASE3 domain sensor protein